MSEICAPRGEVQQEAWVSGGGCKAQQTWDPKLGWGRMFCDVSFSYRLWTAVTGPTV